MTTHGCPFVSCDQNIRDICLSESLTTTGISMTDIPVTIYTRMQCGNKYGQNMFCLYVQIIIIRNIDDMTVIIIVGS